MYRLPIYAFDPHRVWAEVPSAGQSTASMERAVCSMTMIAAYMMGGGQFKGSYENYTLDEFDQELNDFCEVYQYSPNLILDWAQSLLLDPRYIKPMTTEIETTMPELGITLHGYQRETAGWMATRKGGIVALSCGVGKTVTAWAAALAAVRTGACNAKRCTIICPVNAAGAWQDYLPSFRREFDEVFVYSVDSTHKYRHEWKGGGALIIDECHKVGNTDSARTFNTFDIRLGYEWCACLTGTLLHTGPEKVIAIQDTAVPGMSRFADRWKFGDVFNCIILKKVGKRTKQALAMPSGENFEKFVSYLSRGTRSLSFASPEVAEAVKLPGQTKHLMDTWPTPPWVQALQKQEREEIARMLKARDGIEPTKGEIDELCTVIWIPTTTRQFGMAVCAVAGFNEMIELAKLGLNGDHEPMNEEEKNEIIELPTAAKIRMDLSREGRIDRCVRRVNMPDGTSTFRWVYAPGSDMLHPKPGVKIQSVLEWIANNPKEPALIGSASSLAKRIMIEELTKMKKKFGVIDGTVPAMERIGLTKQFQSGEIDYMLVQQVAGSESITLTRACNSFLIDHSWSPLVYTQYLARTCRTSQTRMCDHYDLVFGALQTEIVLTLQRGEAFDIRVRTRLEEMLRESLQASGLSLPISV